MKNIIKILRHACLHNRNANNYQTVNTLLWVKRILEGFRREMPQHDLTIIISILSILTLSFSLLFIFPRISPLFVPLVS